MSSGSLSVSSISENSQYLLRYGEDEADIPMRMKTVT